MTDQSDLGFQNYDLIQQIFLLGDDLDRRQLLAFGLSVSRFNLLRHLEKHGRLTATDLCQLLLCDKANVTSLLDGLEREDLVRRTPDDSDGRRTYVTLTLAGETHLKEANDAYQASVLNRFICLSSQEKLTLNELLSLLITAFGERLGNS